MNTLIVISMLAIVLYVFAATQYTISLLGTDGNMAAARQRLLAVGVVAVVLHSVVLYQDLVTAAGINLGFFNAGSLVSWMIVLVLLIATLKRPMENLAIVLLPMAALTIALEVTMPGERIFPDSTPLGLQSHIALSVLAYSVLTVAALQAVVLSIQDHQLRTRHPGRILNALPPLQVMEELLFQLIGLGFFLLSLGLLSGLMFVENLFAQHLVHKTVLSLLAWLIFATLLWGRWRFGWRGKTAIRWTLGGFISLMLAYFGSKLVLEIILGR